MLKGFKFVENDEELELVSRFSVEDNNQDEVEFKADILEDVKVVKSVFKSRILNYTLFTEE